MMRRSLIRLGAGAPAGRPTSGAWTGTTERPGDVNLSGKDYIRTLIDPFYHCDRLSHIEEHVDARRARKWVIMVIVLAYPTYFLLFGIAEGLRMPSLENGNYPAVQWNDEKAGKQ